MQAISVGAAGDMIDVMRGRAITDWKGDAIVRVSDPFLLKLAKWGALIWDYTQPISLSVADSVQFRGYHPSTAMVAALMGVRPDYTELDKRINALARERWEVIKDRQTLQSVYDTWAAPSEIAAFNTWVDRITKSLRAVADNAQAPQSSRDYAQGVLDEMEKTELRIDVKKLIANKAKAYVDPKTKPDKRRRIAAYLARFGVKESDIPRLTGTGVGGRRRTRPRR